MRGFCPLPILPIVAPIGSHHKISKRVRRCGIIVAGPRGGVQRYKKTGDNGKSNEIDEYIDIMS